MHKMTKMYMQFRKFMNKNSSPSTPSHRLFKSYVLRLDFTETIFYFTIFY